jgi:hypothetical protein
MSTEPPLAQLRRIGKLGASTPLIVPSFSSRGFSEIGDLFNEVVSDLRRSCLLSAFDLDSRSVTTDLAQAADIVVVDSGVYETRVQTVAADGHTSAPAAAAWTRDSYRAFLPTIPKHANVLVVSFDDHSSLKDQLGQAIQDFALCPSAACDFLMKPSDPQLLVVPDAVLDVIEPLRRIDVLGVTEKELGSSLLERCCNLVRLRRALTTARISLPVHVFGAITPGPVLAYFMCGADIFDGLNWLRYVYGPQGLSYVHDATVAAGDPAMPDAQAVVAAARANIRFLHRLQDEMSRYAHTSALDTLAMTFPVARRAFEVAQVARSTVALSTDK